MALKTGAELTVFALEQVGVKFTFGIPGVHNTEIYDQLNNSQSIQPILVTHEMSAAFAADAVSRTSPHIGCLVIVPAAGTTHALSGIGEAYLDGIPLLVISGGTRRDSGRHFQLHDIDQENLVKGITKDYFLIKEHSEIIPTIYKAYEIATSGMPGPVFVEIPAELQLFKGEVSSLPKFVQLAAKQTWNPQQIDDAVALIQEARAPGIYLGWGAHKASAAAIELAELLQAPVATTLQGLSVFPGDHPLHTGMGFGAFAVPACQKAFEKCDLLIAVGARFGELATGSYSMPVPQKLIHIDINPDVFNKNYDASLAICADAKSALEALVAAGNKAGLSARADAESLRMMIKEEKHKYREEWTSSPSSSLVSPGIFFRSLRQRMGATDILTVDDGNHTFLAEEQYPVTASGAFISPTDFNAMGYAVPAAVGAKLANPEKKVATVVGDGAFLMSGLELITAKALGLGIVVCVFHDGELAQIAQLQKVPLNRKTCTVLGDVNIEGVALATGAHYLDMRHDGVVDEILDQAFALAEKNQTVLVDVRIDYSKKTRFTQGVVKANLARFPLKDKVRFISRALKRHVLG